MADVPPRTTLRTTRRVLWAKTRRDLARRRSQIAAVAVTVFLGIVLFAANIDAAGNLAASYEELYDRLEFGDVWATAGPTDEMVERLARDPDVTAVATRTRFDASLEIGGQQLRGTVIGVRAEPVLNRLMVLHGTGLESRGTEPVAVVEQHGWEEFGLAPGDPVSIHGADGWRTVRAVGGAASAEYVWLAPSRQQIFTVPDEFAVVFVPEAVAREIAPDAPLQVTASVRDHDPQRAADWVDELTELGASDVYARADQASNQALQADVTGFEQLSFLFPVLFLTVAGMAAFVLLSRLVRTERPQIGMMVANGMSPRTIRWHYTSHALVAVLLGAIPGLVVGMLLGRWISGLYTDFVNVPITVVQFSAATVVWSLGFAIGVALLAGGLPARAAARIQPAEAMRPPAPTAVSRRSLIERVWPGELPQWVRMALRNVTRSRRRFVSTTAGIVLAMVLVIVSMGLSDTVFDLLDRAFNDVDRRDLVVSFDDELRDDDLTRLASSPDIASSEPFAEAPVVLAAGARSTDQLLQAFEPSTSMHGFESPLPESGIVLGSRARDELRVSAGDRVTVALASGERFEAEVAAFVSEPVPAISYVSIDQWRAAGGAIDTAVVALTDRSAHEAVRAEVQTLPGVTAVVDQQATQRAIEELMALTYLFVGLMVAFAIVMAVALVYNMVSVSIAERTGEVATLEANGVGRRLIARTVTIENLMTVAAGAVPGTILGWIVAGQFIGQFDMESLAFQLALRDRSLVVAIVLVLGAALVAQWPGLRSLRRLDLATVVRERCE
ncbi:MAG: FtsX-like permease family protein [Ilumatobacter sp.]|uniref:ABC transporter permease n=1 Tax=Ilumatobacter sp. TaxID=1967498 RepID=UPI002638B578|nr:FtsX-like permease family protein [Ilumatobacter sp.]MDJ0767205.1 FtsX-like permease family protein [Ilumatobacter sp.]